MLVAIINFFSAGNLAILERVTLFPCSKQLGHFGAASAVGLAQLPEQGHLRSLLAGALELLHRQVLPH